MAKYCPACGGPSESRLAASLDPSVGECIACGFVLDDAQVVPEEWAYEPPSTILFADDSSLLRSAIEEALLSRNLAESVLGARDGAEFLETFTWQLREGNPVELVILDVEMPRLDGFGAAVSMRAVERAFNLREPTPLLFFSARPVDAQSRAVLEACRPATYINKMASPDLGQLAARVEHVIFTMLRRRIAA